MWQKKKPYSKPPQEGKEEFVRNVQFLTRENLVTALSIMLVV